MTFVVPFDGSELAVAALVRAVEYGTALEEDVTAVTVVPERKRYAKEKGWIDDGDGDSDSDGEDENEVVIDGEDDSNNRIESAEEIDHTGGSFDVEAVIDRLREQVASLAPRAAFDYERIREFPPEGEIANHVEQLALAHDPSVVFLGSENVGRIVTPLSSVGAHVAAEETYDVFIVRHVSPPDVHGVEPHAEFYRTDGPA